MFSKREKLKHALKVVQAYKSVFLSEDGQTVLVDMAGKCRMTEPVTDVTNPNGFSVVSAFYDGKRAAFLDIVKMLGFQEDRLIDLLKQTGEQQYEE